MKRLRFTPAHLVFTVVMSLYAALFVVVVAANGLQSSSDLLATALVGVLLIFIVTFSLAILTDLRTR